ncbi:MAG: hypothetical protein AABY22_01560 [Nanoarchaeota archaeon]
MKKKAQTDIVVILISVFVIVMILFVFLSLSINDFGGSAGQHSGIITAFEHRNNLIWDAELVYFKSSDESTQEDIYCVKKEIIEEIKEYSKTKEEVIIYFQNNYVLWKSDCNGGISIINKVEKIK